ncbi:MAG: hypothetical protein DBY36_01750 [Clostridiales bacterium]|nr:MAG: hypothetical protein DBY36_01750 [Clostridiales bacterium]
MAERIKRTAAEWAGLPLCMDLPPCGCKTIWKKGKLLKKCFLQRFCFSAAQSFFRRFACGRRRFGRRLQPLF